MSKFFSTIIILLFACYPVLGQNEPVADIPAGEGFDPITILSPLRDSLLPQDEPLEISLLLSDLQDYSLVLLLDGTDITVKAQITGDYLYYLSDFAPQPGPHQIRLTALSGPDTVFSHGWMFYAPATLSVPEEALPWEFWAGMGWQYSDCSADTAGLGLSYPVGFLPKAELSLSGQLGRGNLSGNLSYDPAYDKDLHGQLQFSQPQWELWLGEFYPRFSELAFSGLSPLGGSGTYKNGRLKVDLLACRSQPADTGYQTFAQYIYGGQSYLELRDSLVFSAGYFAGYDDPSSLPDSVRYKASAYVYTDDLLGISDAIISVDTLHPGRNRLLLLSLSSSFKNLALSGEYIRTRLIPDTGKTVYDQGYSADVKLRREKHLWEASYTSLGQYFYSFGNPYAEAAKNELALAQESNWSKILSTQAYASAYKIYTDSAAGNSYKAGASLRLSGLGPDRWFSGLSLNVDYNLRPYTGYLYQSRSLGASLSLKWKKLRASPLYSYSASQSDRLTRSHSANLDLNFTAGRAWQINSGYQYYQLQDDLNSVDQLKHTGYLKSAISLGARLSLELGVKQINKTDRLDQSKSYRQRLAWTNLGYRF
ncbi:hypothetical protein HY768_07885 [candidate division TA06 bacterium]|uniref:Uncharacterized protein n=1 Tax=candidate division TA06 bacterium TaxID=2250710 RepID=A0A933IAB3_UNCT6|nr:hypothetical protein [candidate division TA06 bacterium]